MLLDDVGFSIIIATYFIPLVRNTAAGAVGICFMHRDFPMFWGPPFLRDPHIHFVTGAVPPFTTGGKWRTKVTAENFETPGWKGWLLIWEEHGRTYIVGSPHLGLLIICLFDN